MIAQQIAAGLAYSLLGFAIGFLAGRITREVHEIKEVVVDDKTPDKATPHDPPPAPPRLVTIPDRRSTRWPSERIIGIIMLALAVGSVSVTWYAATEQRRVTDCQADYNQTFSAALVERNQIIAADRRALIDLTDAMLSPGTTPAKQRIELERYNATLRENDRRREQFPLPQPVNCQ